MVVLQTSKKALFDALGFTLTDQVLTDTLFSIGFELEESSPTEYKIDITTDRIDALSTHGLARVIRHYLEKAKPTVYAAKPSEYVVKVDASLKKIRPHTRCFVAKKVPMSQTLLDELIYIQEKLHATLGKQRKKAAIGIYPLHALTWPITFCAKKDVSFTPLGQTKSYTAQQIIETLPIGKQYGQLLQGVSAYPVFVSASGEILSLPPIINSETTGKVSASTKELFIEVSGHDEALLEQMCTILATLLIDSGAVVEQVSIHYGKKRVTSPVLEASVRKMSLKKLANHTSLLLNAKDVAQFLTRMGHTVVKTDATSVSVRPAPYRVDIWHPYDLYDDVVRAYGLDQIQTQVPQVATTGSLLSRTVFVNQVTDVLVGFGLQEVRTLAVCDTSDQFSKMRVQGHGVALAHTAEKSINMLRANLLAESMKLLQNNRSAPLPQRIFEIGDVLEWDESHDVRVKNVLHLCMTFCGDGQTYTVARQHLEALGALFGWSISLQATEHGSFISGRCFAVSINGTTCGHVGEVHPEVLANWGIEYPVSACELALETVMQKKH